MVDWTGVVDSIRNDKKNIIVNADDNLILTRYGKDKIEDGIDTSDVIYTILEAAQRGGITPRDVAEDNRLPLPKVKDACTVLVKKGFVRQVGTNHTSNFSSQSNYNPMTY